MKVTGEGLVCFKVETHEDTKGKKEKCDKGLQEVWSEEEKRR